MHSSGFKYYKRLIRYKFIKLLISALQSVDTPLNRQAALLMKIMPFIYHREIIRGRELLPDLFSDRADQIVSGMIKNQVLNLLECIHYERLVEKDRDFVTITGTQFIEDALRNGTGGMILSAHFGNWELIAYKLAELGYDMNAIARPQAIDQMTSLMNEFREKRGVKVLMQDNLAGSLKLLKQNKLIGIVADLNARERGFQVDFFGKKASFYISPVLLGIRSKAPLFPTFIQRMPDGKHVIEVQKPIFFFQNENRRDQVQTYVDRYVDIFKKRPDHWVWFHERYQHAELGKKV
ncbi:MAG: lysophospholipid acyltransferase family protein [Candidatus Riflebacteria bacterium]|nr:lysophospholipid acyltransferase family protein [Candidatus Riflebacteria bacterium]